MRCETCDNGVRRLGRRAQVAEKDGRVALVLSVPVEVCDSCGEVWRSMETAKRLDELFRRMLSSDLEVATRHYDAELVTAA